MDEGARAVLALLGGLILALGTVPLARRLALATDFLDRPRDYKKHGVAVPYLGGLGLIAAFTIAAALLGDVFGRFTMIIVLALALCLMGSIDDRFTLPPGLRFVLQLGAGALLWADGVRWEPLDFPAFNFVLTLIWVAGLTNAFNLLDNIDGAAGATGAASALGIGALALHWDSPYLAACAFALAGACAGFLCFNLTTKRKIFLGDGGSLPLGFLIAALSMSLPSAHVGSLQVLAVVPLAGVAIFDTTLVVISRTRRGVGILTGGRDHSTHRLLVPLGSAPRVALLLFCTQIGLGALAYGMAEVSRSVGLLFSAAYIVVGLCLIAVFESPSMAPSMPEASETPPVEPSPPAEAPPARSSA